MLPQDKKDNIYNALIVGMTLEDAYIFAGCTPNEILLDKEDEESQLYWAHMHKQLEYTLLDNMKSVCLKQVAVGRHEATVWMLEKLFPRYAAKNLGDVGTINLVMKNREEDEDAVTTIVR
jgi:hypothetical protein